MFKTYHTINIRITHDTDQLDSKIFVLRPYDKEGQH